MAKRTTGNGSYDSTDDGGGVVADARGGAAAAGAAPRDRRRRKRARARAELTTTRGREEHATPLSGLWIIYRGNRIASLMIVTIVQVQVHLRLRQVKHVQCAKCGNRSSILCSA